MDENGMLIGPADLSYKEAGALIDSLEIATYYNIMNLDKYLSNFQAAGVIDSSITVKEIKMSVLLAEGCLAGIAAADMYKRPFCKELVDALGVEVWILNIESMEIDNIFP